MRILFNKTYLQTLEKELSVRENILPILKAKELALNNEIIKLKKYLKQEHEAFNILEKNILNNIGSLLPHLEKDWNLETRPSYEKVKKAGVWVKQLNQIEYHWHGPGLLLWPSWLAAALHALKPYTKKQVLIYNFEEQIKDLEKERKKTTCRINLYEKVQIPEYQNAILSIERYLEDEEHLEKASLKLLKRRLEAS